MKATRLLSLPPYLFEELEDRLRDAVGAGRDVIDLSVGDPDLSPPQSLVPNLIAALKRSEHHRYPPQRGRTELKECVRSYLAERCGVEPSDDEILILVGSKEGLAHLPWAVCNPGDAALVPDPGYPVYGSAARFAGCRVVPLPLGDGFAPAFDEVSPGDLAAARLCFLNYPNNPTGATVGGEVFAAALDMSARYGTIVVNDAAYADVYFGAAPPPSLLCAQPDALRRPAIEFFSFSKTFSITGWRIGFAVGHRDIIDALAHLKANIDSGAFGAIQEAVAMTWQGEGADYATGMRREYRRRRDVTVAGLDKLGFECLPTCATFYVWSRVPGERGSMEYVLEVLERANVLMTPGVGFGAGGEGYFRVALTQPVERLEEAIGRIAAM